MENGSKGESSYTEILNQLHTIAVNSKRNDIQRNIKKIQSLPLYDQQKPLLKLLKQLVTTKERNKMYLSLPFLRSARKRHRENLRYLRSSVLSTNTDPDHAIQELFHIYQAQKQHLFSKDRLHLRFNEHSISLLMEVEKLKRASHNFHQQRPGHTLCIPSVADKRSLNQEADTSHAALLEKATDLLSDRHTINNNELQARILMAKTLVQTLQITPPENCTEEHQQLINDAQSSTIATLLSCSPLKIFQKGALEGYRVFGILKTSISQYTNVYKYISNKFDAGSDGQFRVIEAQPCPHDAIPSISDLSPEKKDSYSGKFQIKIDKTGNPTVLLSCGAKTEGQTVTCFPWYDSQQQKFTISKVAMQDLNLEITDADWLGENLETMTEGALVKACKALVTPASTAPSTAKPPPTAGEGLVSMFTQIADQLRNDQTPNRDLKLDNILFNPYTRSINIIDNTDNPPPGTFYTGLASDPALLKRTEGHLVKLEGLSKKGLPKNSKDLTDILCPESTPNMTDFDQKCLKSLRCTLQDQNPDDLQKILCGTLAASVALGSMPNRFHDYWALLNCGEAMAYRYGIEDPSAKRLLEACTSEKKAMLNALTQFDVRKDIESSGIQTALEVAKAASLFDRYTVEDTSFLPELDTSIGSNDFVSKRIDFIKGTVKLKYQKSTDEIEKQFTEELDSVKIGIFINKCQAYSQLMETQFPISKINSLIEKLEPAATTKAQSKRRFRL